MSTGILDMSILAENLWFGERDGKRDTATDYVLLRADGNRPITLDFKATDVEPPASGKVLIMQARTNNGELWAIRMLPSGRLWVQAGTGPSRESLYGYPGIGFQMGASFNPMTGNLSVVFRDPWGSPLETFHLNSSTAWASPAEGYEILLGAPEGYADKSPLGWRIDCSFRYRPEEQQAEDSIRKHLEDVARDAASLAAIVRGEQQWQAMLALATRPGDFDPRWIADSAAELVDAHNAWKEGRS